MAYLTVSNVSAYSDFDEHGARPARVQDDDPTDLLFRERTPESAAHQLSVVLAWLAECQLATLEQLRQRRGSTLSSVVRQQAICDMAVQQCRELGVRPSGMRGLYCRRLDERMNGKATAHRVEDARARGA